MQTESQQFLIIPGVHKGGTTSIYKYLSDHPKIFNTYKKELHFFTPIVYGKKTGNTEDYHAYFSGAAAEKYLLDVSPSYFYGGTALINELQALGKVKILLLLRNPTDRFISFYKQGITNGKIPHRISLDVFFEASQKAFQAYSANKIHENNFNNRSLREGCYAAYLPLWLDAFKEDIKIIYFEDLCSNPADSMEAVCAWLDIENIYTDYAFTAENKSFKPKSQFLSVLSSSIFMRFEEFFRKNKWIKNTFKKVYTALNRAEYPKTDLNTVNKIKDFYSPHNQAFYQLMEARNLPKPKWD